MAFEGFGKEQDCIEASSKRRRMEITMRETLEDGG